MQSQKTPEQIAADKAAKAKELAEKKAAEAKAKAEKAAADKKAADEKKAAEAKAKAEKAAAYEKSLKTPMLKKTKDNYIPDPGTEDVYHARIERKSFNGKDGARQSKPKIQFFDPKTFKNFDKHSAGLGYSVDILHDPTGKYPLAGVDKVEAENKAKKEKK